MQKSDASVRDLQHESERCRAELAATLKNLRVRVAMTSDELREKVSPAHVKREINDYVRERRETLTESLKQNAKENPLQAVAIGAAIAYPAVGLLRAIPLPLYLIGAGLFLSTQRGRRVAVEAKGKLDQVVQQGSESIADFGTAAKSAVEDQIAGAASAVESVSEKIKSAATAVTEMSGKAFSGAKDVAVGAVGSVNEGSDKVGMAAAKAKDAVTSGLSESRVAAANFLNDNALLVAGIGLFMGAFIASSLPSSDAENNLFGAGSDKLKEKARQAAAQGIDQAGEFAATAAGGVMSAAASQGLDASGLQKTLNEVGDKVRNVGERALTSAIGDTPKINETTETERTTP